MSLEDIAYYIACSIVALLLAIPLGGVLYLIFSVILFEPRMYP